MLNVLYSPFLNEAPEARRPDCDQEVSTDLSADLELPNLKGKVVVMNQGLEGDFSEETSKELIALGAKVYIFDQHVLKKQGVCEKDYGDHCLIECDMTNLESVQHAALIFLAYEEKVREYGQYWEIVLCGFLTYFFFLFSLFFVFSFFPTFLTTATASLPLFKWSSDKSSDTQSLW